MIRWTPADIDRLRELAAQGRFASEIAALLNTSYRSVLGAASTRGIRVKKHTPAELEDLAERARDRDRLKKQKRRQGAVARRRKAIDLPTMSKTSAAYRNTLPRTGTMSKAELQAMLAEAVRNTAGAAI